MVQRKKILGGLKSLKGKEIVNFLTDFVDNSLIFGTDGTAINIE